MMSTNDADTEITRAEKIRAICSGEHQEVRHSILKGERRPCQNQAQADRQLRQRNNYCRMGLEQSNSCCLRRQVTTMVFCELMGTTETDT